MPVINIKSLPVQDHTNVPEILIRLNNEVSRVLRCDESSVWSYWEFIKPGYYAVGKQIAAKQHEDSHSPIVTLTGMKGNSESVIAEVLKSVAKIISTDLQIEPWNVFVVYNEVLPSMIFDGGKIVEA